MATDLIDIAGSGSSMVEEEALAPVNAGSRDQLGLEIRRNGGDLDASQWVVPTPEQVTSLINGETDQGRVDQFAYNWLQEGKEFKNVW